MSQQHSYAEIARDWHLWCEFVDPDGVMTREEFDAMSPDKKINLQTESFGPESYKEESE